MKKFILFVSAFALVLGFSQCSKKPVMPSYSGPAGDRIIQNVTLNATQSNGGDSKIVEDGIGKVKWEKDDIIIVKQNDEEVGELKCTDPANDEFTGSIIASKEYDLIFDFGTRNSFEDQTGDLDYAIKLSGTTPFKEEGNYEVEMKMSGAAVLKLDLSYFASPSKADVTVEIRVKAEAESKEESVIASVKCASDRLGEVYVAVPANENKATYTFSGNNKTVEKSLPKLDGNTFYTAGGTGEAEVITPKFTVAAGTTVEFAPGNLYYDADDNGCHWKFESNQWDYRTYEGKNSCINGSVTTNGTPSGDWGLFGWSGSTGSAAYGMSTSENETDYGGDFKDWGGNAIGSDAANTWRTLTNDEWNYLLGFDPKAFMQTKTFGRPNAMNLCAWKELDGHKGLVILPDGTKSSVMSDITSTSDLATYGAVFLPAAGCRLGMNVSYAGLYVFYWSSTPSEDDERYAYYIYYSTNVVSYYVSLAYGCSVRLVRDVK